MVGPAYFKFQIGELPEAGLYNKSSCTAAALGVTKVMTTLL